MDNRFDPLGNARSPEWPRVRDEHLKVSGACIVCAGTDHLNVHHIRPFHLHPELELDPTNLVTLCEHPSHDDHEIFGHLLDFKSYNADVVEDAAAYLEKVKNRPYE